MEKPAIETVVNGDEIIEIDYSQFVTEDDTPVDNLFSEKQQRLLTEPLYASWQPARPFAAFANVGLFYAVAEPAVVPDAMLSLDVALPENAWEKPNRSYFIWKYGKAPEVVIEVVSNLKGQELTEKMDKYAKIGIPYYVVYDPAQHYGLPVLRVFENLAHRYLPRASAQFDDLGLSLVIWQGEYEGMAADWLRWGLPNGGLIPTGHEQRLRADAERQRADTERLRADRLAQRLRELGLEE
jgi:Uma2 family endonuclease